MHAKKQLSSMWRLFFDFLEKRRMSDLRVETTRHNPSPFCLSTLTTSFTGLWIVFHLIFFTSTSHHSMTIPMTFAGLLLFILDAPPWNFKSAPLKILEKEILGNHHFLRWKLITTGYSIPIGSMGVVYLPTWKPWKKPNHPWIGKYTFPSRGSMWGCFPSKWAKWLINGGY